MAVEQGWGRYRELVPLSPDEASTLIGETVVQVQAFTGGRRNNIANELAERLRRLVNDHQTMEAEMSAGGPCLSHSDYKPWNLLVADAEVAAVLDWEFAFARGHAARVRVR